MVLLNEAKLKTVNFFTTEKKEEKDSDDDDDDDDGLQTVDDKIKMDTNKNR